MSEWLAHHGILGQKWGVRRFQNADGTLTEAGKRRYGEGSDDTYGADRAEAKYDRGKYLRETGRSTGKEIVKGVIGSKIINRIFDSAGNTLTTSLMGYMGDNASGYAKGASVLYTAIRAGKLAAKAINWGYRIKNISDIEYAKKSDKIYKRESQEPKQKKDFFEAFATTGAISPKKWRT